MNTRIQNQDSAGVPPAMLINLSGPYAVGKDSIIDQLLNKFGDRVHRVQTLTTRPVDTSVDPTYTHLDPPEFYARVTGNDSWIYNVQLSGHTAYATNLEEIRAALAQGKYCLHSIYAGPSGAGSLRAAFGAKLLSIGILPSIGSVEDQLETLKHRLFGRNRDDEFALAQRIKHQTLPLQYISTNPIVETVDGKMSVFDSIVVNDDFRRALNEVMTVVHLVTGLA